MTAAGFPHSGISGSLPTCGSPKLFAAYRALPRLSVPRHPPCALFRLTGYARTPTNPRVAPRAHRRGIPIHRQRCSFSAFATPYPFTRVFKQSGRGNQPAAEPFKLAARLALVKASSGSREPPRHPFFARGDNNTRARSGRQGACATTTSVVADGSSGSHRSLVPTAQSASATRPSSCPAGRVGS